MSDIYFEIVKTYDEIPADGIDHKGVCFCCSTLEEAMAVADREKADIICEIGGGWAEYKKCWFCEEWRNVAEMNANDLCERCENYLKTRGEI